VGGGRRDICLCRSIGRGPRGVRLGSSDVGKCTNSDGSDGNDLGYGEAAERGGETEKTANCYARGHRELPSIAMYDLSRAGTKD
jgi:hypothetical protein